MLERKIYADLLGWKNRDHKCLLVTGQRQIGKTYIIEAFAKKEYEHFVYINFYDSPRMDELFSGDATAPEIIRRLALRFGSDSIVEGKTLLFLDEIQDGRRAYGSLKQFSIYGKLDVIASGSLLGVRIPQSRDLEKKGPEELLPVGYEEVLHMHPLDFEEYLWARGFPRTEIENVRVSVRERRPIDESTHARLSELFREYMIVGGMPEAVDAFSSSGDFRRSNAVQKEIAESCIRDINRYNSGNDRIRTAECFDSIPYQLSDTNKKFMYSRISGEGTRKSSDRYMENLLWIKGAGYGNFCYGMTSPDLPVSKYIKKDVFKVYLSDTGLLLYFYGDKARKAVYDGDAGYNFGAVAENVVAECFAKNGMKLAYYRNDKGAGKMELDFVTEFWDGLTVIEVKSGKDRSAASLSKVARSHPVRRRIMLETDNIYVDGEGVEHYPMYCAAFVRDMDVQPEGPLFS